jgi:hypothetical protein
MSHLPIMKLAIPVCIGACLALVPAARAVANSDNVTVVAARAADDYSRIKLPDGTFKPEGYAFAEGGHWNAPVNDKSLDSVSFLDIARTVSVPLATQSYLPSHDPNATKLLIVVYWGRTTAGGAVDDVTELQNLQSASAALTASKSSNQQQLTAATHLQSTEAGGSMVCGHVEANVTAQQTTDQITAENNASGAMAIVAAQNAAHDKSYAQNAAMLGYDSWLNETSNMPGTALAARRQDVLDELQHDRYFVVLMAYDFQMMWKEKKHKLLWETRMSIPQRGAEFNQELASMAMNASRYFGQDTHGLVRRDMAAGHVDVGDIKTLGVLAEK